MEQEPSREQQRQDEDVERVEADQGERAQLGPTSEGPNLVAYTDSASQPDYEQNKLVLNAIMATLTTP